MKGKNIYLLLMTATLLFLSGCASKQCVVVPDESQDPVVGGSVLERGVNRYRNMIDVRLVGSTEGSVAEIFGKVVSSAPGVVSAKRYSSRILSDNPQGCWVAWRATVSDGTGAFELQTEMMEMFREIIAANGYVTIYRIPYRYNENDITMLKRFAANGCNEQKTSICR